MLILTAATGLWGELRADGAYMDLRLDLRGRPGTETVSWIWAPHFPRESTQYWVFFSCDRTNSQGVLVGSNKAIAKNISCTGLDSAIRERVRKLKAALDNGSSGWVVQPAQGLGRLAGDSAALCRADLQVKGSVQADDFVRCSIDVTEIVEVAASGAALESLVFSLKRGETARSAVSRARDDGRR